MFHARIAARAFNTPLLVEPTKAMAFLSGLGPRILGRPIDIQDDEAGLRAPAPTPRASLLTGSLTARATAHGELPFPVVDGIAVIEISGVLIHGGAWIGESSGQTSYEGIAAQIDAAAKDPSVRAVALEIDSFGGEVAGVFDLADKIRALRRNKPVWAFVAEHAFSAGYALASQADRILLPRTGAVGSIGVVVMHAEGGYFSFGTVEWQSGANAGRKAEVVSHDISSGVVTLTLLETPVRPIAEGDAFVIRAGCDKRLETCGAKFSNSANFRGFPHIPGQDAVIRYASRDGGHTGGVL